MVCRQDLYRRVTIPAASMNVTKREIGRRSRHAIAREKIPSRAVKCARLSVYSACRPRRSEKEQESRMRLSKNDVRSSAHTIPALRFEDQALTSFSGLVLYQALFGALGLKERLFACVRHVGSSAAYGLHQIISLLIVHLILGWRRLRDLDCYRDDPLVKRLLGLSRLPDVSAVSRALRRMTAGVVSRMRLLCASLVLERIKTLRLARLTIDFDGSVLSTKARATEGTAIGYNKKSKGSRSYYPLFATVAQTTQVFDVLHRPGNVHDSNGALEFIKSVFGRIRKACFAGDLEARLDSAHFGDETCRWLDQEGIQFSVSLPFERFPQLKGMIAKRSRWNRIDDRWSFFELRWKPKNWEHSFRVIVYRQILKTPRPGPVQLDLFEPFSFEFDFKAVMTNKTTSAMAVLFFHNGRGSQEAIFAELKAQAHMDYLPTRRLIGNQVYLLSAVLAHNLNREMQMRVAPRARRPGLTRPALFVFDQIGSFRKRLIQRAGRLTRPNGVLTLTLSANQEVARELRHALTRLAA
jgi:Transposase DDE domain group 1